MKLDGGIVLTPEQVDGLWSKPAPADGLAPYCRNVRNPHGAEWRSVLDTSGLEPGEEYLIQTEVTLDRPVRDGADFDGDGRPDVFPQGLYTETEIILVIVD